MTEARETSEEQRLRLLALIGAPAEQPTERPGQAAPQASETSQQQRARLLARLREPTNLDVDIPSQARGRAGEPTSGLADPNASGEATVEQGGSAVRTINVATSAWHDGIAAVVGMPVDQVAAGLRAIGIDSVPVDAVGGSRAVRRFLESIGANEVEAKTATERVVATVAREMGAAAPFVLGGGVAGMLTRAPAQITTRRLAAREAVIGPSRTAPIKTALAETGLAATAGAGGVVGKEVAGGVAEVVAPGFREEAETAGTLIGNVAGGIAPAAVAGSLRRTGSALAGAFRGPKPEQVAATARTRAEDIVARSVADIPRARERLATEGEIARDIPGFRKTTAALIDEPGFSGIEAGIASKSPEIAEVIAATKTRNNQAIASTLDSMAPAEGGGTTARKVLQDRVDHAVATLEDRMVALEDGIEVQTGGAASAAEASGQVAVALREGETRFAKSATRMFDAVDPSGDTFFSAKEILGAERRVRRGAPVTEAGADRPGDVLSDIRKLQSRKKNKGLISYDELRALRSRIGQDIREIETTPAPNRNKIRKLATIKKAIDATLDDVAGDLAHPDVAARYKAARTYFAEGSDIFRKGAVGRHLRRGRAATADTSTLDSFITGKTGAREGATQLRAALGEGADGAVRDYSVRKIYDQATDINGNVNFRKMQRWLKQRSEALDQFPAVRDELQSLTAVQRRIDQLARRKSRVLDSVERGSAKLILGDDVEGALRVAMKSPSPGKATTALVRQLRGDTEAVGGLRRALWDDMLARSKGSELDRAGSPFLKPYQMRVFIEGNAPVFKALGYTVADTNMLLKAAKAAEITSRMKIPGVVRPPDPPAGTRVLSMNQLLSRLYGIQRGVVSPKFVVGEVSARLFKNMMDSMTDKQVQELLAESLINPALASDLLHPAGKAGGPQAVNRIRAFLLASGILGGQPADVERQ